MDLAEHLRLMWRSRWLVLGVSLVVAVLIYVWSSTRPDVYESAATIDVLPSPSVRGDEITKDEVEILSERFAALASTTTVLRDAINRSGLDIGLSTARRRVSADSGTPGFVTVRAEGPSPDAAVLLAGSVVDALGATGGGGQDAIDIVSPARAPSAPAEPRPGRDALLAFLIALVVTAELAALVGVLAGRLPAGRAGEDVERLTGAPVLARTPGSGDRAAAGAFHELREAFRELRARVELARSDLDVRTVAVTGVEPGCGASFVARWLTRVSANPQASVVLIDANLRRPSLATEMRLPDGPGLSDVLLERPGPAALPLASPGQGGFRVLGAGAAATDLHGVLGSGALRKVIDRVPDAELVVIDAPSVIEGPDALVIAAQCDAVILVVDARRTRQHTLREAVARLDPHARILGTVLNRVDGGRKRTRVTAR